MQALNSQAIDQVSGGGHVGAITLPIAIPRPSPVFPLPTPILPGPGPVLPLPY